MNQDTEINLKIDKEVPQTYEFQLDLLGHEIFKIHLGTSSTSDRWSALSIIWVFCTIVLLGAYGEKLVELVRLVKGTL